MRFRCSRTRRWGTTCDGWTWTRSVLAFFMPTATLPGHALVDADRSHWRWRDCRGMACEASTSFLDRSKNPGGYIPRRQLCCAAWIHSARWRKIQEVLTMKNKKKLDSHRGDVFNFKELSADFLGFQASTATGVLPVMAGNTFTTTLPLGCVCACVCESVCVCVCLCPCASRFNKALTPVCPSLHPNVHIFFAKRPPLIKQRRRHIAWHRGVA